MAAAVTSADLVAKLSVAQSLTVKAFRTEKLLDGQFVAQTVTFGDNTVDESDDQAAGTDPAMPRTSATGRSGPSGGSALLDINGIADDP